MAEVKTNVKYQYLAAIFANITSLSYGVFVAWPSATFPVLQSKESPLETGPMTSADAGWVGSILCLGGAVGTIVFAWCAQKIGRRKTLMLIVIPALISWLIIPFAKTPAQLCISRFMGGFSGGGTFGVVPIYITEIADNNIRGMLGTFVVFSCNIGVLLGFIFGYFCTHTTVAWIMLIPCVLYICTFPWMPETPQHLIRSNKIERAEKSFYYFRNLRKSLPELPPHLKTELEKLKSEENQEAAADRVESSLRWQDFADSTAIKALLIGLFFMSLASFCGVYPMLNYTATVFQVSKSNLSPNMSAIVVGVIQIIGAYFSVVLVEKLNRKTLLTASCLGTAFGEISLGTYIYLGVLGFDTSSFSWVPLFSFSFTILSAGIGVLPLTLLMLPEVMPPKIRSIGCMSCMLYMWLTAFMLLKLVPFFMDNIGLHGMMFLFGIFCAVSTVITLIFVPETKGKSIEEIMELLR